MPRAPDDPELPAKRRDRQRDLRDVEDGVEHDRPEANVLFWVKFEDTMNLVNLKR